MTKEQFEQAQTLQNEIEILENIRKATRNNQFYFLTADGSKCDIPNKLKTEIAERFAETLSSLYYEKQSTFECI